MLVSFMSWFVAVPGIQDLDATIAPLCPEPLHGAWQVTDPPDGVAADFMVRLEPDRLTLFQDGRIIVMERIIDYVDDVLRTASHLEPRSTELWREGEHLGMVQGDEVLVMKRVDPIPDALVVSPWPFGDAELDEARRKEVLAELRRRGIEDQKVRQDPVDWDAMARIDKDNTAYLKELVKEIGWIDATRFGTTAAQDAFLIVQHSMDRSLMLATLPHVEADVKAGRVSGDQYALMYDRLHLALGRRQLYGSQVVMDEDGMSIVQSLEDPEHVDARRASLGMMPLKQYVAVFGGKSVVLQRD